MLSKPVCSQLLLSRKNLSAYHTFKRIRTRDLPLGYRDLRATICGLISNEAGESRPSRVLVRSGNCCPLFYVSIRTTEEFCKLRATEMIEIADHPWFVAGQFHPEFNSTPRDGHPLFEGFVAASFAHQKGQAENV